MSRESERQYLAEWEKWKTELKNDRFFSLQEYIAKKNDLITFLLVMGPKMITRINRFLIFFVCCIISVAVFVLAGHYYLDNYQSMVPAVSFTTLILVALLFFHNLNFLNTSQQFYSLERRYSKIILEYPIQNGNNIDIPRINARPPPYYEPIYINNNRL